MRLIAAAISVVILVACLVAGGAFLGLEAYRASGPLQSPRIVVVERGASVGVIAERLETEGLIDSATLFRAAARVRGDGDQLRAGEYAFDVGISMEQIFEKLTGGETVVRRLTVPEGLTVKDVVVLLRNTEALKGDIAAVPAEGSILPETYHFSLGDERQAVLDRMTAAMSDALDQAWQERDDSLPLASPQEALILASIVEKETALAVERPLVAAVFLNRLRRGMKLQADPTVVYGLERERGPLGRPLTRADLQLPTPYNTYIIEALPPGPIANPGEDALRAVLNPAQSDYLYFVADGSGGHAFARSLREHNRNVAKWRRHQRQQ